MKKSIRPGVLCGFICMLILLAMSGCRKDDFPEQGSEKMIPEVDYDAFRFSLYVDNTNSKGSDENPGTEELPLQTIQHAANIAGPGDVICVKNGSYRERVVVKKGGDAGNNLLFNVREPDPPNPEMEDDPLFVNPENPPGADGIPFTGDDGLMLKSNSPAIGMDPGNRNLGAYQR